MEPPQSDQAPRRRRRWMFPALGCMGLSMMLCVVIVVVATLSEDGAVAADCRPALPELMQVLSSGLTITGGGSISDVRLVRSTKNDNLYFVAGRLQGPGLGGDSAIAVWMTDRPSGAGTILAVNATADAFGQWLSVHETTLDVSMSDPAARAVTKCVKAA